MFWGLLVPPWLQIDYGRYNKYHDITNKCKIRVKNRYIALRLNYIQINTVIPEDGLLLLLHVRFQRKVDNVRIVRRRHILQS